MYIEYCYGPKWPYLIYIAYIGLFGTGICRFVQVLYLGRAPHTKETLPDFREKCRVTRHSRVFRGLTGSQRTPGFWGVTPSHMPKPNASKISSFQNKSFLFSKTHYRISVNTLDYPPRRIAGYFSETVMGLPPR